MMTIDKATAIPLSLRRPRNRIHVVAIAHNQEGSLAANSLGPSSIMEPACAQKDKGGLPQNGIPGLNHGVIQSPVCIMSRAISAYLGSEGSAKGSTAIVTSGSRSTSVSTTHLSAA